MLVANGIPPNQKTNAWMTAVEQYLRFLSLAGTAAFATQRLSGVVKFYECQVNAAGIWYVEKTRFRADLMPARMLSRTAKLLQQNRMGRWHKIKPPS